MFPRNLKIALLSIFAFCCLYFYLLQFLIITPKRHIVRSYPENPFDTEDIKKVRNCLIEQLDALISSNGNQTLNWMKLDQIPSHCSSTLSGILPILNASSYENKYFLPPPNSKDAEFFKSCSILTFGIGQEVIVEEILKQKFPQCSFLGFDPDEINKDLYEGSLNGTFVKAVIGGHRDRTRAYLRK